MTDIAADRAGIPQREFRIGKVLSSSFEVFFRQWLPFCLMAGALYLPMLVVSLMLQDDPTAQQQMDTEALLIFLLFMAMFLVLYPLSTAVILYGAFQDMRRRPVRIGEAIAHVLTRFFPLLGVTVCVSLGVMLGVVLLIVPGVILMLMWLVAVPACVVERTGPLRSLGRSRDLTKGHRWKLLGLIVVVYLALGIGGALLQVGGYYLGGSLVGALIEWVTNTIGGAFGGVLTAIIYHDLRVTKEGVDIERMAAVFD